MEIKFDGSSTLFEKVISIVLILFLIGVFGYVMGSLWGIFQGNLLYDASKEAGPKFKVIGTGFFTLFGIWGILLATDGFPAKIHNTTKAVVWLLLFALTIAGYCGFFVGI